MSREEFVPQYEDNEEKAAAQGQEGGAEPTETGAAQRQTGEGDLASGDEDPRAALAAAQAEAQSNYDRYLRAVAELDNYRKRAARVRSETREEVLRDVLLQIAPILDNLDRALAQATDDAASLREGVELIQTQFHEVLRRYGLEAIEAVGQPFDPTRHEALMQIESEEHPPGTVVDETEKGYTLNQRVVRPARVVVSKSGE